MKEIKFRQPIFNEDGSFRFWNYWAYIDGLFIHPEGNNDSYQYIGVKFKDAEVYEGDIIRWMAEDGDCFKGVLVFEEPDSESHFLSGFCVANPIDITDEVLDEDGGINVGGWNGEPQIIGNIVENPELIA